MSYTYRIVEEGYAVFDEKNKKINRYPISSRSKAKAFIEAKKEGKDTTKFMTLPRRKGNWRSVLRKSLRRFYNR